MEWTEGSNKEQTPLLEILVDHDRTSGAQTPIKLDEIMLKIKTEVSTAMKWLERDLCRENDSVREKEILVALTDSPIVL